MVGRNSPRHTRPQPVGRSFRYLVPVGGGAAVIAVIIATVVAVSTGGSSSKAPAPRPVALHAVETTVAPVSTTAAPVTDAPPTIAAPEPIVPLTVVFNGPSVTVRGSVPSDALKQHLNDLAKAFAAAPGATVDDEMTVNPAVALTAGVDVFDAQAPKFDSGQADISPEHAAQFDRVVAALQALPKVTVTVVGHADQTGTAGPNYILSQQRAIATVNYIVIRGIDPSRISAQAVGDTGLVTSASDPMSLTVNRRVEFIFYGLLS